MGAQAIESERHPSRDDEDPEAVPIVAGGETEERQRRSCHRLERRARARAHVDLSKNTILQIRTGFERPIRQLKQPPTGPNVAGGEAGLSPRNPRGATPTTVSDCR